MCAMWIVHVWIQALKLFTKSQSWHFQHKAPNFYTEDSTISRMEFLKVIILANQYSECQGVWSGHMETLHETTPRTHQEVKDPLERLHESSAWVNLSGRRKRLAWHPTLK